MGQELIKSAVDASVFVINLTPALIRFVMTAALVLLSAGRRTTSGGGGGAHGAQWSAVSIRRDPAITSVAEDTAVVSSLFGVWRRSPV